MFFKRTEKNGTYQTEKNAVPNPAFFCYFIFDVVFTILFSAYFRLIFLYFLNRFHDTVLYISSGFLSPSFHHPPSKLLPFHVTFPKLVFVAILPPYCYIAAIFLSPFSLPLLFLQTSVSFLSTTFLLILIYFFIPFTLFSFCL